jgi:hypothetical protein
MPAVIGSGHALLNRIHHVDREGKRKIVVA